MLKFYCSLLIFFYKNFVLMATSGPPSTSFVWPMLHVTLILTTLIPPLKCYCTIAKIKFQSFLPAIAKTTFAYLSGLYLTS